MIIIPRIKFLIITLLSLSGMIFLGLTGYRYIASFDKAGGESFFYTSLVITVFITVLFLQSILRSRNISKQMDRLIHLSSMGEFSPGTSLKRLGKLGDQIDSLYYHLNSINKKRALKIRSQASLIDFITTNSQIPVITTDPAGKILYVSKQFMDKNNVSRSGISGKSIDQFLPNLDVRSLCEEMDKTHTFSEYKGVKDTVEIYPVTDIYGETAYLVFIFGKHRIQFSLAHDSKQQSVYSFLKKVVSK